MVVPAFLIRIAKFLGLKAAEKAVDVAVDSAISRKENKRTREQLSDIQDTVHEIRSLASAIEGETTSIIQGAVSVLKPMIEDLHVNTAHQALNDLRTKVKATDRKSLSRIDYYRGCCSRYTNRTQCIDEYNLAWQEMIDDGGYDPEIVAGKIYVHCINNEQTAAIQAANKLKTIDRNNIWAWVPELLFSENLTDAYTSLADDIDKFSVLANACLLGNNSESIGIDINSYYVILPTVITFENIPEWVFYLTVLMNRYIQEWNMTALFSESQHGRACIEFNEAVNRFNDLCSKTQLGDFVKGIRLWYLMSQYQKSPSEDLLKSIKDCDCGKEFYIHRALAYSNFLAKEDRQEDAKQYLTELGIKDDASILNTRLLLALQTSDAEYAVSTLQDATDKNIEFNLPQIVYLLSAARFFPESVKPFVEKIRLPEGIDSEAVRLMLDHFTGSEIDDVFLMQNRDTFSPVITPHLSLVLQEKGHIEEAIALCEKGIPPGIIDMRTFIYIDILQKTMPAHADKLYKVLGDLRRHGFTDNHNYLAQEYSLASRVRDVDTMLEISEVLHKKSPKNASYYVCYISSAINCQQFELVKELSEELGDYEFNDDEAGQMFNVLLVSGLYEKAVEFLYNYIKSHPVNEGLNMLFHGASINTNTGKIINEEYETVFNGAYVRYLHNGEAKSAIVTDSTRLKVLIGKSKGDTAEDYDRMQRKDEYQVVSIHNKYYEVVESIYKDIGEGNYVSATPYHFTDEEMNGGHIIEVMNKMVGHDEDWFRQRNESLSQYKKGELTLAAFLQDNELIPSIYEHLYGPFKVYGMPFEEYDKLHELRNEDVEELTVVLDLPALILLFELQQKFDLTFARKFIISSGLFQLIKATLLKEQHGTPSFVYQSVADLLRNMQAAEGESWMVARLRSLVAWIENNVEVEQATEILNVDDKGIFAQSVYFTLFYESMALAQRGGRMLMSIDQSILRVFAQHVPVTDVNAYIHHFCPDHYMEIGRFFIEASILGGGIDTDYVLNEYNKHALRQPSYFKNCQESLTLFPAAYKQVLAICIAISKRPIKTEGDNLIVESLLKSVFELFDRRTSGLVLKQLFTMTSDSELRNRAQGVYRMVHPLY